MKVMERLGIAEQMKAKTYLETRPGHSPMAVLEGKGDLGFALISEILPLREVVYVGPLPKELQSYVVFTAGVSASARDAVAAKAWLDFLRSPAIAPTLNAKGMEPG